MSIIPDASEKLSNIIKGYSDEKNTLETLKNKVYKTVVFVGNGAINKGSEPLINTFKNASAGATDPLSNLRINFFHYMSIATFSYKFKMARASQYVKWRSGKEVPVNGSVKSENAVNVYFNVRNSIASEYVKSQSNLNLRFDKFNEIHDLIGDDATFITTNWDLTLWNESEVKEAIYLHGICSKSQSMVFPTELIVEDRAYDFVRYPFGASQLTQPSLDYIRDAFRLRWIGPLFTAHQIAVKRIDSAKRVILWGYSLSDYDADINSLFGTYVRDDHEIIIINPDLDVIKRSIILSGNTNILHYDPITRLKFKHV